MSNLLAFPTMDDRRAVISDGMELRDYFAAKAMQALINAKGEDLDRILEVPEYAYQIAEAMMEARNV